MIHTYNEIKTLLPALFSSIHLPVFLLDKNGFILAQPSNFIQLKENFFTVILTNQHLQKTDFFFRFLQKEFYFFIPICIENISFIAIGPVLMRKIQSSESLSSYDFLTYSKEKVSPSSLCSVPYFTEQISLNFVFLYQFFTGKSITRSELKKGFSDKDKNIFKVDNELKMNDFMIRENPLNHYTYQYELRIMEAIKNQNSTQARIYLNEMIQIPDYKELAQTPLQASKYKFIAAIAVLSRSVIQAGVPVEKAYNLSDVYVRICDQCLTSRQIYDACNNLITDLTKLVKDYSKKQEPQWLIDIRKYISQNLHKEITLAQLAQHVAMSPNYLSSQFKKITDTSLKEYINSCKIKEAQFLIKNTKYSLSEISVILNFSSQSHFQSVFKKITGVSPKQFKNDASIRKK